ncbi:hypothetical protein [Haloterrigena alkaliphila]|uniref:Uncharacterized protein n=1 Tax=Haloterrigena alkaliphila TaxID=2816475 RepID=A0A8A2VGV5_9EURY|nr:hypothetical protein [Haloterrigena alkaliphila]QSW99920.1 hypothetical protein J0X25_02865 [Haloterrigena alkaliphila]
MSTPPPDHTVDGPRLSRRTALAGGAALVSAMAGCTGHGNGHSDDGRVLAADAPADATVLAHLETESIAAADDPDRVLEGLAAVEPIAAAAATLAARTGLDPLDAIETLSFAVPGSDGAATAVVAEGDWTTDAAVASLEEATGLEYEAESFEDESVLYRPTDAPAADAADSTESTTPDPNESDERTSEPAGSTTAPVVLGSLTDGRFVAGDGAAVEAALAVRHGGAGPVDGRLRDAHDDARGAQLTVASLPSGSFLPESVQSHPLVNGDPFEAIEAVGRSYAATDQGTALDAALHVSDEDAAAELESVLEGLLPLLTDPEIVTNLEGVDLEASDLDGLEPGDIDLGRDGAVVRLQYEGSVDVFALLDEV